MAKEEKNGDILRILERNRYREWEWGVNEEMYLGSWILCRVIWKWEIRDKERNSENMAAEEATIWRSRRLHNKKKEGKIEGKKESEIWANYGKN